MPKKKQIKNEKNAAASWRSLQQSRVKPVTAHAKSRKKFTGKKVKIILVSGIAALMLIVSLFCINKESILSYFSPYSRKVKHIEVATDGVLPSDYVKNYLGLPEDIGLMNVDIFEVKGKLETIPQVRTAIVERDFPHTLRLSLEEYKPILKIVALNQKGQREGLFISKEGKVFKGVNYPKKTLKTLLYLSGINLKRNSKGEFNDIPYIPTIAEFLQLARSEMPHLYSSWRFISLEYFHEGPKALGSFIKIRTKDKIDIVFSPENFSMQLHRLDSIFSYASKKKLASIERVDLSLGNQVVVKIARDS